VNWLGGEFRGGAFRGGEFLGGEFLGGAFLDGAFLGGAFRGGAFRGGEFRGGEFLGGAFIGGEFLGGAFLGGAFIGGAFRGGAFIGGEWKHPTIHDRLLYMASMIGIVFDSKGYATAWRSTAAGGKGRYTEDFVQKSGRYFEVKAKPAGAGVCVKGIHVSTQAEALTYFGISPTAELWRVRFKREDLLDCDAKKARIRGGFFTRVPWPFYRPEGAKA
jgi:hypothetical protein